MACYIENVTDSRNVLADIKQLIPDAGMRRRMSKILKTAVSTAVEALHGVENINALDAIITATGWGCLEDSERFLRNIIDNKEQMLNPTPFIQSTFNTVGGQIALMKHNHCYNVTYVNRSHSFEDALLDASMRIEDGESENILVGAFDEQTHSQQVIMERMGMFRKIGSGQGAVFVNLKSNPSDNSLAKLSAIDFPTETMTKQSCQAKYATSENTEILYNQYTDYGLYPTASAQCFAVAVDKIKGGASEVIIYNEYFGATPTVLKIQCIG